MRNNQHHCNFFSYFKITEISIGTDISFIHLKNKFLVELCLYKYASKTVCI